jgi:TonB family protein
MAAVLAGGYYANESGRRLFFWAVAGSLTLHLAVLFLLPVLQEAQRARPAPLPLHARLANPKPPEPAPPKVEPPAHSAAQLRPRPTSRAAPQPAFVPAVPQSMVAVEPAKQAVETANIVPQTPAPPPVPTKVPAASGPDPGTVAQFRLELMDLARRYKKYPRIAQENNWEGRVELRIAIGVDGAISSITVKKGAGRAVLDDEAQAMIRSASSKATIPPGLRGKAFALEIPVDFYLKEEER